MRQLAFALTALAIASVPVRADQPLPIYDIDGECRASAPNNIGFCVRLEQDFYDSLKAMWPGLADEGRSKCLAIRTSRSVRYHTLFNCADGQLQLQQLRADQRSPQRFKP